MGSPIAFEALERIGELYRIERRIKGRTPEERYRVRQTEAVPRLRALYAWLSDTLLKVSKSSELAKAIRYTIKSAHWPALTYYCEDGRAEIDKAMISYCTSLVGLGWAGTSRAQ